tara:strand:- start:42 stop:905 length:864 start_codon:yes stop_codon:yes gene_type:complete
MARNLAKQTESLRVKFIIDSVNSNTQLGIKLKESFERFFGKKVKHFENTGGGLKDHYDLVIVCEDGTRLKCEEKGTNKYHQDFKEFSVPWYNSVQRFNGPGDKFTIGIKYSTLWYNLVVNEKLTQEYSITSHIPSLEKWLKFDAFQCGNPKTNWGLELKKNYRLKHPNSSMNGKGNSPKDYRELVNSQFDFTIEDKEILIKETQEILDFVMSEKECWLQTCGVIEDKINFKWHNKLLSPKIIDIEMLWSKGSDIYFLFITDNVKNNFKCILRFGKGTGFSNIRFDIR